MKQRQPKKGLKSHEGKLLLRKETLRTLTDGQLSIVGGGLEDTRTSVTAPAANEFRLDRTIITK